jgi:hypothetical protein
MAKNKIKTSDAVLFWQNVQRLRRECLTKQFQKRQPRQSTATTHPQRPITLEIYSRKERRELEAVA